MVQALYILGIIYLIFQSMQWIKSLFSTIIKIKPLRVRGKMLYIGILDVVSRPYITLQCCNLGNHCEEGDCSCVINYDLLENESSCLVILPPYLLLRPFVRCIIHTHWLVSEVDSCWWTIKTMIILTCIFFGVTCSSQHALWVIVPTCAHCSLHWAIQVLQLLLLGSQIHVKIIQ